MKENETIKEYSDRLLNLENHIRLLGSTFNDSRIVEKILVIVPEKFEDTITTLENTKDLSKISLAGLLSAFQAQEKRRVMRQGGVVEGALPAKHHVDGRSKKKKKNKKYQPTDEEDKYCLIKEASGLDLFKVKMRGRSFLLNPLEEERGFHPLCVEPPLLKEDIPPDDEGWLCPGCDYKVDYIDLLNDLQGTDLSATDSWEKVYPKEAVAAASREKLDDISGLRSDDLEDDDYNPKNPYVALPYNSDIPRALWNLPLTRRGSPQPECATATRHNRGGPLKFDEWEIRPGESKFYSAFEDLAEAPPKYDGILGFSSKDSEDDDFNPGDPDKDESVKTESSSSHFTSDSEDFSLIVDTDILRGDEQGVFSSVDNIMPNSVSQDEKAKVGKSKRNLLKNELSYLMQSVSPLFSAKRHVERCSEDVEFVIGLGNEYVQRMADPQQAHAWIEQHVQPYHTQTKITCITIGKYLSHIPTRLESWETLFPLPLVHFDKLPIIHQQNDKQPIALALMAVIGIMLIIASVILLPGTQL
ncbi:putative indole-3-acetic acid-amido synthetase GH3.1-like [Capsicum annuum]|nr:putative indole-3-acetic acid-amido synthetase GH3.1-like [Capsicum annuum]